MLTGELIGAGSGILVAGVISGMAGWRVAIGALALPAVVLAWALRGTCPSRPGAARPTSGGDEQ